MHIQNLVKFYQCVLKILSEDQIMMDGLTDGQTKRSSIALFELVLKILSGNEILKEILTPVKGRNYVTNVRKMMYYESYLGIVNINAYTKFG